MPSLCLYKLPLETVQSCKLGRPVGWRSFRQMPEPDFILVYPVLDSLLLQFPSMVFSFLILSSPVLLTTGPTQASYFRDPRLLECPCLRNKCEYKFLVFISLAKNVTIIKLSTAKRANSPKTHFLVPRICRGQMSYNKIAFSIPSFLGRHF